MGRRSGRGFKDLFIKVRMWASIHLPQPADTFMFHGQVMYRHLKEQKLALFTSFGGERRNFADVFGGFQGYQANTGPRWRREILSSLTCRYCKPFCCCCCFPISHRRRGPEPPATMPLWMEPYFNTLCKDVKQHNHAEHRVIKAPLKKYPPVFCFFFEPEEKEGVSENHGR